jgi:diacylglycerol kinase family enzyme
MAGIGFDAKVVDAVTPRQKRYLRSLAFALTGFRVLFGSNFPPVRVLHEGKTHVARFAIVANGHYYGGDFRVSGPGLLTSGELETILIERVSLLLRPDIFASIMARRPLNRAMNRSPPRRSAPVLRAPTCRCNSTVNSGDACRCPFA